MSVLNQMGLWQQMYVFEDISIAGVTLWPCPPQGVILDLNFALVEISLIPNDILKYVRVS